MTDTISRFFVVRAAVFSFPENLQGSRENWYRYQKMVKFKTAPLVLAHQTRPNRN